MAYLSSKFLKLFSLLLIFIFYFLKLLQFNDLYEKCEVFNYEGFYTYIQSDWIFAPLSFATLARYAFSGFINRLFPLYIGYPQGSPYTYYYPFTCYLFSYLLGSSYTHSIPIRGVKMLHSKQLVVSSL